MSTYDTQAERSLHAAAITSADLMTSIELVSTAVRSLANGRRSRIDGAAVELDAIAARFAGVVSTLFSEMVEITDPGDDDPDLFRATVDALSGDTTPAPSVRILPPSALPLDPDPTIHEAPPATHSYADSRDMGSAATK